MSKAKMQRCFNCGAELGVYEAYYRDLHTWGAHDCLKEEQYWAEREKAYERLDDEMGYGRW